MKENNRSYTKHYYAGDERIVSRCKKRRKIKKYGLNIWTNCELRGHAVNRM